MISKRGENKMGMTFNDKYSQSIQNLSDIDMPDYSKDKMNHFVDFVELLAVFSDEDGISYGDVQDRFFGEPDENNTPERNDDNESFVDGIFDLIKERIALYGILYPFLLNEEQVLMLKASLSIEQELYLFLLLSSSLDIFYAFNTELTTDFETLSLKAMEALLPNAIVKPFGKNSEYQGTAIKKIKELAQDLGLPVKQYELDCVGGKNVQERGLDIVGWIPFADKCQNKVVFLCQCACGKSFEYKQHDTRRFENYYEFYKIRPQHTLFVPYSLINPKEGKFYHSDYIENEYLVFERLRILSLISGDEDVLNGLKSKELLEKVLELQNDERIKKELV